MFLGIRQLYNGNDNKASSFTIPTPSDLQKEAGLPPRPELQRGI